MCLYLKVSVRYIFYREFIQKSKTEFAAKIFLSYGAAEQVLEQIKKITDIFCAKEYYLEMKIN